MDINKLEVLRLGDTEIHPLEVSSESSERKENFEKSIEASKELKEYIERRDERVFGFWQQEL